MIWERSDAAKEKFKKHKLSGDRNGVKHGSSLVRLTWQRK